MMDADLHRDDRMDTHSPDSDVSRDAWRQETLNLARQLDRLGRRAEQFLIRQLQQLQLATDDFEHEKLAWRRQQQREQSQLAALRQEMARERRDRESGLYSPTDVSSAVPFPAIVPGRQSAPAASSRTPQDLARDSDVNPVQLLLHPGAAGASQLGAWMYEFTKLNIELGGGGTRFEIVESRLPPRRLFGRRDSGVIVELDAFSILPLIETDTTGSFEVDRSEYLESWIEFKSHLLQSSLINIELEHSFRECSVAPRHLESRSLILDAVSQAVNAGLDEPDERRHLRTAFRVSRGIDSVRQQLQRLENCTDTLFNQCGFRIHLSLR